MNNLSNNAKSARDTPLSVSESTFTRQVLGAPLPTLALFGASTCPASRALRPLLRDLAAAYAGRLLIATASVERAPLLAEQLGVVATPTLLAVRNGAVQARAVGFLPAGLLRLLAEQIANDALPPEPFWSPLEATFEDVVLLPLLEDWNLSYVRQYACPAPARGRVDVLVYADGAPLTLFENKRHILSSQALAQATAQANAYAVSLGLASFVVAAPAGLWIYARSAGGPLLVRRVSTLELAQSPASVLALLQALCG